MALGPNTRTAQLQTEPTWRSAWTGHSHTGTGWDLHMFLMMLGFEAGALSPVRIVHMWFFLESSDPELQVTASHLRHGAWKAGWVEPNVCQWSPCGSRCTFCIPAPTPCALAVLPISIDNSLEASGTEAFPTLATL